MHECSLETHLFKSLAAEILASGNVLRFQARGGSMAPFIRDRDILEVQPIGMRPVRRGEVVLYALDDHMAAHRVIRVGCFNSQPCYFCQGDSLSYSDGWIALDQVYGRIVAVERSRKRWSIDTPIWRCLAVVWTALAPLGRFYWHAGASVRNRIRRR